MELVALFFRVLRIAESLSLGTCGLAEEEDEEEDDDDDACELESTSIAASAFNASASPLS